ERLSRDRRAYRRDRRQGGQREDRPGARRGGEAVSLRAVPDSAAQDERDQLRQGQADRAEQDEGGPRPEPPRRHQGARLTSCPAAPGSQSSIGAPPPVGERLLGAFSIAEG